MTLEEIRQNYKEKELGRSFDYSGKKYNKITLLYRIEKKGNYWAAQCECGNCFIVLAANVIQEKQKSCGCLKHRPQYKNLKQQKFGDLTAIEHVDSEHWRCLCSCGSEAIVQTNNLLSGHTRSCGHLRREKLLPTKMNNLTGRKFGELTALEPIYKGRVFWKCRCSCGKIVEAPAFALTGKRTISCGHLKESKQECRAREWLISHNIPFYQEVRLKGLENLRFDFQIFITETDFILLEIQGEQHYRSIDYFGGKEKFAKQIKNDQQKRDFCAKNKIVLYEMPYYANVDKYLFSLLNDYCTSK